jgi:hypothetical protein
MPHGFRNCRGGLHGNGGSAAQFFLLTHCEGGVNFIHVIHAERLRDAEGTHTTRGAMIPRHALNNPEVKVWAEPLFPKRGSNRRGRCNPVALRSLQKVTRKLPPALFMH